LKLPPPPCAVLLGTYNIGSQRSRRSGSLESSSAMLDPCLQSHITNTGLVS
jgi:hypothetical protein